MNRKRIAQFQQFGVFPQYELGTTWSKDFGSLYWKVNPKTCDNSFSILYEGVSTVWEDQETKTKLFILVEDDENQRYLGLSLEKSFSMVCGRDVQMTNNENIFIRWIKQGMYIF